MGNLKIKTPDGSWAALATQEYVNKNKPNWNENNPDSPAYIANRTHYENPNDWVELLVESSPDAIAEDDGMMMGMYAKPIGLEVGKKYRVKWNGVEYECVAVSCADLQPEDPIPAVVLGNYGIMIGGDDTGEPFIIMDLLPEWIVDMGAGTILYLLDGSAELTLKVEVLGGIKKIDNKYLNLGEYAKAAAVNEGLNNINSRFEEYYTKSTVNNMVNPKIRHLKLINMTNLADTGQIDINGLNKVCVDMSITSQGTEGFVVRVVDTNNRVLWNETLSDVVVYAEGGTLHLELFFDEGYYFIADVERGTTNSSNPNTVERYRRALSTIYPFKYIQITTASGNPITAAVASINVYGR